MDFCRNVSVSGGLPTEYPSEQVISPTYSKHNGIVTNYNSASLDDLFPIQNTEGDVSLEWLSAFVEDCLSSTGNCIPAASTTTLDQANPKPTTTTITPKPCEKIQTITTPPSLQTQSMESSSHGQPRRCTHCLSQRTPQWRAGPLGPKTLCNACGVRFKSGRLLPEYRPAKSPTFVSYKHSNSHKKVMEMRMSVPSSTTSNDQ
ncbi:Gata transcription factor [Thalictrum thalictroides]|uniref:Gata transcription factor n=1 Tax=Thalictrum thalictroides TaxID=46969 RepID=A0A7J6UTU6_THATH|nr:Gata transcription factor [Thalictrum thalictroides]